MKTFTVILLGGWLMLLCPLFGQAQTQPAATNTFDVIIKKNGEIINGLVMEVDLQQIKYKRTDIPDGPVYTIARADVYAINYRNQIKELLAPADSTFFRKPTPVVADTTQNSEEDEEENTADRINKKVDRWLAKENFSDAEVRFHLGFIRGFTKVNNVSDYESAMRFPGIGISYDAQFKENFRMGVTFGVAGTRFKRNQYDSYDSLQINRDLNETLLLLNVYAKRRFGDGRLRPYLLVGLGLNGSFLKSTAVFAADNASDRRIQVSSNSRALSLGIQARLGVDYEANPGLMVFGDVGAGLSVLQFGIGYKLPGPKAKKQPEK